ncbi:MAG: DNA-binding domain-containing protein [Alphaproteobacteria bacterium]|nr:DNA-binding domain-containing protein [Alphaproteobacteria bacterium]
MVDLLTLQKAFLEAYEGKRSFKDFVKMNTVSHENRFSVYKGNVEGAFRKALEGTYPLTWKLIGQKCADGAAYAFIRAQKSYPQEGTLLNWGRGFPEFLKTFEATKTLSYLSDFAKLEYLMGESLCAEEKTPLIAKDLKNIPPHHYGRLVFIVHPSLFLFYSPYPLDQVVEVVEEKVPSVALENRGSYALIIRQEGQVKIHWLSKVEFTFFSSLLNGNSLGEILEKVGERKFNFQEILSFSLKNGVFSGYTFVAE